MNEVVMLENAKLQMENAMSVEERQCLPSLTL